MWLPLLTTVVFHFICVNDADKMSITDGLPHIRQNDNINNNAAPDDASSVANATITTSPTSLTSTAKNEKVLTTCPSGVECAKLGGDCLNCSFNYSCIYGAQINVTCQPKEGVSCFGEVNFKRTMICRYCYQTNKWDHVCRGIPQCRVGGAPRERYIANCTVKSEIICLGNRQFPKNLPCSWTSGHRWTTTLILSITLGGFGADRFYLGHWQEGIGKLFSFGGLGVWTIVDVILVAIGYLKPADGSLYIW